MRGEIPDCTWAHLQEAEVAMCPKCGTFDVRYLGSRSSSGERTIRRYRCNKCKHKFER
jgi:DNA-directed RNA polymerase subunit M/transcription elongation factor TFIIS